MAELHVDAVIVVDPLDIPAVRFDEVAFPAWPVSVRIDGNAERPAPVILRFGSELQLQRWVLAIADVCRRRAGPPPQVVRDDGEAVERLRIDACIDEDCAGGCLDARRNR